MVYLKGMLEDILNSKTKANLTAFFVFGSRRAFTALEISKLFRLPYLKAAHALNYLANLNLVRSYVKRGRKYYILNYKYQFAPNFKSLLPKQRAKFKKDKLISDIKKLSRMKAAFLSGIFAGYSNLPVDILLVGKVDLRRLAGFLQYAERLMGQEINYSIMTANEFLARRNTFDRFIRDIFDYRYITVMDKFKNKKS